jgi:hypothetical protein
VSSRRCARVALIVSLAASGCDSTAERERESAAQVARAEEQLRTADNPRKGSVLGSLDAPCVGKEPCEVQRLCRAAYRLHVEAVDLTGAAKQKLAQGSAEEAAKLLGSAQEKLEQAGGEVANCTLRAGALRRQYKL